MAVNSSCACARREESGLRTAYTQRMPASLAACNTAALSSMKSSAPDRRLDALHGLPEALILFRCAELLRAEGRIEVTEHARAAVLDASVTGCELVSSTSRLPRGAHAFAESRARRATRRCAGPRHGAAARCRSAVRGSSARGSTTRGYPGLHANFGASARLAPPGTESPRASAVISGMRPIQK